MSFKNIPPEKRAEMARKSAETRRANAAARKAEAKAAPINAPPSLADLGFAAPVEDGDFTVEVAGLLSAQEIAEAEAEGRKRYLEDQKRKQRKAIADKAYADENIRRGTETPEEERSRVDRELVEIYINMPRAKKPPGMGQHDPEPILLDGRVFTSGRYFTVERHQADYLMGLMDLARRAQNMTDGISQTYYNEPAGGVVYGPNDGRMMYQGGTASGGGGGPGFDAIHRRPG